MAGQGFQGLVPGLTWVGWENRIGYRVGLSGVSGRAKGQWEEGAEKD